MKQYLPETGYLRLFQIIGQSEVTLEHAIPNQDMAEALRKQFPVTAQNAKTRKEEEKLLAKKLARVGPRCTRPAIPAIIPVSKSSWWAGVKSGRYPAAVKLGERTTCWRVEDIRALIQSGGV